MALPFKIFLLDALNNEQKPSVKKRLTGRSTVVDFEIYRSGRKILAGSISASNGVRIWSGRENASSQNCEK